MIAFRSSVQFMPNPLTYAEIDLSAIAHNTRALSRHVGPAVQVMAVVKANAYGHGAVEVARTALRHGATRLAVARVLEGVQLRQAGIAAPILVLGYTPPHEALLAVEHNLSLAVIDPAVAEAASARAVALGRTFKVHVKVDSGMGRFGLLPEEVLPFLAYLAAQPGLSVEGIFTHFATADSADKTAVRRQFARFSEVLGAAAAAGYAIPLRHCANSAAILDLPETYLDAVRPGIALYGLRPSDEVAPTVELRPALTLKSHVGRVRLLPAGSGVSYGLTYVAPTPITAALVPVGYGDGYPRLLSNRGEVLINGRRAPIIGRVCMDQFVVDASGVGPVQVNDEIVLVGRQGDAILSAEEVARKAETINYEIVTALLPRVARVYVGKAE